MIWKDIPGYEGLYQISECGQVKSYARRGTIDRILKPVLNKKGYHYLHLHKNGKGRVFLVHRLVAITFLNGNNSLTINHIDECKTNNHVSNLEYLSNRDNVRSWIKNNPERRAEINKKANQASVLSRSKKILDTHTGRIFSSIIEASRYMYEKEMAEGLYSWDNKIRRGQQDRFQLLNN